MKCENCRNEMMLTKTQKYHYVESGLENVFLDNIEVYNCADCNVQIPIIPKILKLHNTIGFAIICKNSFLTGREMQFLRKNLRIKSQDWARFLRTDKSVYSRWENNSQAISPQSDLLIRYLYLRLAEEAKGLRLEEKIVENLAEVTREELAIVIDVEQIEIYSYLPLAEARRLADAQKSDKLTFHLHERDLFLSELEAPLPFEKIVGNRFIYSAAANQDLALAA